MNTLTTTRAPLLIRPWLHLRCLLLRWNIDSAERYLRICEAEGIFDTQTLRHWRDYMAAERCELAALQAQLRG